MKFSLSRSCIQWLELSSCAFAWWWHFCKSWAWRLCLKPWGCQFNLMLLIMIVAKTCWKLKLGLYEALPCIPNPKSSKLSFQNTYFGLLFAATKVQGIEIVMSDCWSVACYFGCYGVKVHLLFSQSQATGVKFEWHKIKTKQEKLGTRCPILDPISISSGTSSKNLEPN